MSLCGLPHMGVALNIAAYLSVWTASVTNVTNRVWVTSQDCQA